MGLVVAVLDDMLVDRHMHGVMMWHWDFHVLDHFIGEVFFHFDWVWLFHCIWHRLLDDLWNDL